MLGFFAVDGPRFSTATASSYLFLHAARTLGTAPEDRLVVEDSPFGAEAARAAGMRCNGFAGGLNPADRLSERGAHTFEHITDLIELLRLGEQEVVR
ncbi:MAG TPA: HAD hydrolase-like protein [Nocardioides sp.]|nr:HAD hydrolase-like protein [Nocardioides sp.]HET6654215.1 HAD hydrolase-like protein [Nocardioides sp.]